jgi:hypothetical protein
MLTDINQFYSFVLQVLGSLERKGGKKRGFKDCLLLAYHGKVAQGEL